MKRKGFVTTQRPRSDARLDAPESGAPAIPTVQPDHVAVTLLLSGGQQYTLTLAASDPLLKELYDTLMAITPTVKRLFQISINGGQAMLAFPSDRLVGLITDPPLLIEQSTSAPAPTPLPTVSQSLVSQYVQLDQFLSDAEHQALLEYVQQRQAEFVPTTTFTGAQNYRESVVLYHFPEYIALITERIQARLPELFQRFNLTPFPVTQVEAQLTAHNDGQFYKIHNDNGSQDTASRELTYVYYFHREPKAFSGGELIIYDSAIKNNYYVQAETFHTVEPRNNSIVFFLSRYLHEVRPIRCPSGQFADSRFTINGWIRR